ncbi:hypothetical protein G9A89_000826 [Geosiphon pyriformis]|nr:hypothetical protein G9A89_000826 [Geosiphon pyriformis]
MSNKKKPTKSEASTSSADSTIEIRKKKTEDSIIPNITTSDVSNSSIDVLRTELTQKFKDFGIDGKSAQYNVGKEKVEEIKKWAPQQVNEFLEKKSEELFLRKEDLNIIKTNRISGQIFLLLTKENLMQDGIKRGPAMRIATLVEKLKVEKQVHSGPAQQTLSSQKRIFEKAFTVMFRDPDGYLGALCKWISQVAGTENYYNYLTIIQLLGYGKTRADCELVAEFLFVYVCFYENGSTGYPPATMKSMDMLKNLNTAKNIDKAEIKALG